MSNDKVLALVRKILDTPKQIKSVDRKNVASDIEEFFFTYPDDKYLWSIAKANDDYYFFYYPNAFDTSVYKRFGEGDELNEMLSTLFKTVSDKLYGMDEVFDDILGGSQ